METPVQIQPGQPIPQQAVNIDELHRQYGEAMIQFKIAQSKVMFLEQQFQALMNQGVPGAVIQK